MFAARNMLMTGKSYRAAVLSESSLVAYWRLGEASGTTAADEKATYAGTYVDAPTFSVAGPLTDGNTAVTFNGTSEYAYRNASVLGNSPSAWTIEFWVNGSAQDAKVLFALGSSTTNNPAIFIGTGQVVGSQSASGLRVFIRNDSGTVATGIAVGDAVVGALTGAWVHVAATYASGVVRMYFNGALVYTSASLTPGTITFDRTTIGAFLRATASFHFAGSLDEVAIYNTALSAARILAHYNAIY